MSPALHDALLDLLTRLVLLAGLPRDSSVYEAGPLLDRGLAELDLAVPSAEVLRRAYVGAISRALLAGRVSTVNALDRIHRRAVGPVGHPPDLAPWCFVWEGLHPADYRSLDDSEVEVEARRLASEWAHSSPQS